MLAIITAVLTGEAFAGVIIVLMQTGGEALDDYGFRRASSSLDALIARAPKIANRRRSDGGIEQVEVKDVAVGDTVIVRSGDLIPGRWPVDAWAGGDRRVGFDRRAASEDEG